MASKSPKDSQPEKKPEREPDNSMAQVEEQWRQTMELLIKKRTKLGEYNTDSQDILTMAKAIEFLLKK